MPDTNLKNGGVITALYGTEPMDMLTTESNVTIIKGLTATKTTDKTAWVMGPLTYFIRIDNYCDIDVNNIVFRDFLQISDISFVENSVLYNDESWEYTYDQETGLLVVSIGDLLQGETGTITFKVVRNDLELKVT